MSTCLKCEGWGCAWCNPRALPMTATKAQVLHENEPPDEPLTEAQARAVLEQSKKVEEKVAQQMDLLRELRLIAINVLGKEPPPHTRLPHKCAHCDRHAPSEKLVTFEGEFYHREVCWRGQPHPFNLK